MASRRELEEQIRAAQRELFPVAVSKMRKHELAMAVESLAAGTLAARSAPPKVPAAKGRSSREVRIADVVAGDSIIHVPEPPKKRITDKATKAELAAYRESIGAPLTRGPVPEEKRIPKPKPAPKEKRPPGRPKKAEPPVDNPFPPVASHAAAVTDTAVDEDDPRASRIVRKGPIKKTDKLSLPLAPSKAEAPKAAPPADMMAAFSAWYASQKS